MLIRPRGVPHFTWMCLFPKLEAKKQRDDVFDVLSLGNIISCQRIINNVVQARNALLDLGSRKGASHRSKCCVLRYL